MADLNPELSELFEALLKTFRDRLKSGEVDAATLGQIRQFLKDNNITSTPTRGMRGLLKTMTDLPTFEDSGY